ncbi:nuclear transport factor 2 family protein [Aurantiacibacter poecillastricola]|uniref:nuclear transport factor 2 family protein n=1 Tax=Aurantiacibacter poecillastricola TaxID=3064385 RepID=UPI00273D1BDB|nr:nuclear transport factor 2 family protein [Aurantiacibacter sp. 219JJ12-13]MDP5262915.1 nuclear transport factor 2 family protein [Aurantiacibacter sp. 219JJ12-13]
MRHVLSLAAIGLALSGCAANTVSDELARQVQELQDEKEIREVLVEYGEFLDARDYASYASLFASNGVWIGGFGTYTGPDAIEAMLEENMGSYPDDYVNKENFHLNTTMVVDVNGDEATARSRYLFFTASDENRPVVALAGRYVDELVREDGEWKILTRKSHGVIPYRDGNAPPPERAPAGVPQSRGGEDAETRD